MNMKKFPPFKYWLLAMAFFLLANSQAATQNSFGFKAGGNLSYLGPTFEEEYGERVGFSLGVTGHYELIPNFYLNPEINYTRRSFKFETPVFLNNTLVGTDLFMGLNYLDIPLNVGYGSFVEEEDGPHMFLLFYGGPQFNFLLSQTNRFKAATGNNNATVELAEFESIRNTDIGLNFGASVGYNQWLFDLRYYFAFTSLFEFEKDADKMTSVSLAVSYRFIFK